MDRLITRRSRWDPGGGEVLPFTLAWIPTARRIPNSSSTNECKLMAAFIERGVGWGDAPCSHAALLSL